MNIVRTIQSPLFLLVLAQAGFITIGVLYLSFSITLLSVLVTIASALSTDIIFANWKNIKTQNQVHFFVSLSTLAAALGILLFFRSTHVWYFVLAAFLAIASKYLIRRHGKHIFNPSNFAIVICVFSFSSATTIEFTQWGSNVPLHACIALISFGIAYYARAILTTLSFLTTYIILLALTTLYLPQLFSVHHYGLIGPSLVLFACFMITDPKTSPQEYRARILHGVSIAALYFFLEAIGVRYAIFASSFILTIANALSGELLAPLTTMRPVLARLPRNLFTCICSCALCILALGAIAQHNRPMQNTWPISVDFLLNGVESQTISCSENPAFSQQTTGILETDSVTEGAAWGDYDNDGYDDLFVSNSDQPSRLYHNDHGSFSDVTAKVGLPQLRSSSAFFIDYDNDGKIDLLIAPYGQPTSSNIPAIHAFHNTGTGHFVNTTKQTGLSSIFSTSPFKSLSFADYDRDGDHDILLAEHGSVILANGEKNSAILKSFFDPTYQQSWWLICDQDEIKRLIPFIQTFADASSTQRFTEFTSKKGCLSAQYTINLFSGATDTQILPNPSNLSSATGIIPGKIRLLENRGGTFIEHAEFQKNIRTTLSPPSIERIRSGALTEYVSGVFWQPLSFDYDTDGLPDIFLGMDIGSSILLRNTGKLTFEDVTKEARMNIAGTGMGTDVADINHDGHPDLFVDNVKEDYLYQNTANGTFVRTDASTLGRNGIGWGTSFLDYDLDGWDDLYVTNGDMYQTQTEALSTIVRPYFRRDNLYRNVGGTFFDVSGQNVCSDRKSGRALAVSDYDHDGDPDVFIGNYSYTKDRQYSGNVLLQNTIRGKHFIEIRLRGTTSNSMGIGALVHVLSNGFIQTKQIFGGSSFYSQNGQELIFGLGTSTSPVTIEVVWPSGKKTEIAGAKPDTFISIIE